MKKALVLLFASPLLIFAGCQPQIKPATGFGYWSSDAVHEKLLLEQESGGNGIEVGELKIYDEASLRIMLSRARLRLAALNGLNEAALTGRLGAVTGSRIDQSHLGIQVAGSAVPGVMTVEKGATTQTTTKADGTAETVASAPTQDVTTTAASLAPPAPSGPTGLAFTPPAGVSGSALDILNEEMQLTYEIANLELLLEGALSDYFVANSRAIKSRATVGFPISITPQSRYKNAVAVVEVELVTAEPTSSSEPPSITALLPREKTYNVAALTDRTTSIGAGAVVGTVGVAGSWASGRKTYYLVQDQDTIAIQRPSPRPATEGEARSTSFSWEFRPVLGQKFVRGGMKPTFVQLAFPRSNARAKSDCQGVVRVRTYWRAFDQKTGVAKEVIKGSVLSRDKLAVPQYDLTPTVRGIDYQDLGNGTLMVKVKGNFLPGTYVQVGPSRYDDLNGLLMQDTGLTFVAPADALARWTGQITFRDGRSSDLLDVTVQSPARPLDQLSCLREPKQENIGAAGITSDEDLHIFSGALEVKLRKDPSAPGKVTTVNVEIVPDPAGDEAVVRSAIAPSRLSDCAFGYIKIKDGGVTVTPLNENTSLLQVAFDPITVQENRLATAPQFPSDVLLDVGHKVFGLADTVVARDMSKSSPNIIAAVPTSLLVAGGKVRAFRLFWTAPDGRQVNEPRIRCFDSSHPLPGFSLDSAVERLVLVAADNEQTSYLLYGNGLKEAVVLYKEADTSKEGQEVDEGIELTAVGGLPEDRVRLLTIKNDKLSTMKKLVLQKYRDQRPLVLDLPQPEKPQPPKVTLDSPIIQNTEELEVAVERVGELRSVKMGDKELKYIPGKDSVRLINLRNDGVTVEQRTRELTFEFNDKTKVVVKVGVVAARVGVQ